MSWNNRHGGGGGTSFFWMVALPLQHRELPSSSATERAEEDRHHLFSLLKTRLNSNSHDLAEVYQFSFPEFRVGTLDSLVAAGEDLGKMDGQIEIVVGRVITGLKNLLDGNIEQVRSSLLIGDVASPEAYVKSFQWNVIKYRTDRSIPEIAEMISQEVQQIDNLLKARLAAYNQSRTVVAAIERRNTGTLLTKDLAPYVQASDFVSPESEYMCTLLVVVPSLSKRSWEASYERLAELVVPRSSRLLCEEGEYALYSVTVFKKAIKAFTSAATAHKFTVREFKFDEVAQRKATEADEAAQSEMKVQWSSLVRLLRTNFGEIFSAWIHLKVLRLFVESVLLYGLPAQYLPLILKPSGPHAQKDPQKAEKKLRSALLLLLDELRLPGISILDVTAAIQTSSHDTSADTSEEIELWSALNMATQDQNPFVKIVLNIPHS